jgi:hypothetical protein
VRLSVGASVVGSSERSIKSAPVRTSPKKSLLDASPAGAELGPYIGIGGEKVGQAASSDVAFSGEPSLRGFDRVPPQPVHANLEFSGGDPRPGRTTDLRSSKLVQGQTVNQPEPSRARAIRAQLFLDPFLAGPASSASPPRPTWRGRFPLLKFKPCTAFLAVPRVPCRVVEPAVRTVKERRVLAFHHFGRAESRSTGLSAPWASIARSVAALAPYRWSIVRDDQPASRMRSPSCPPPAR